VEWIEGHLMSKFCSSAKYSCEPQIPVYAITMPLSRKEMNRDPGVILRVTDRVK
jgi:hypothetical protein